ncbi:armadillo repeat-containing protein 1 [Procambarus clarkii]|uniref:armadillo repeat-containing protein 1 n=1 Tax=Procambarus clarkii TaxID=6728 RepID=UPI001E6760A0|nr:armadillo repeat-containing protein 1-like isoform X3 [Procambarus clarkii]
MGEIELGAAAEATIQAYKELASDPGKRVALALDRTCVQFLAYVIAEGEGSLVHSAIETLSLIAEAKECRPPLANTFGVLEALQSVTEDEECYSKELRAEAAGLFTSLQFARHIKAPKGSDSSAKPSDKAPKQPESSVVPKQPESSEVPKQADDGDSSSVKTEKQDVASKTNDTTDGISSKIESVSKMEKKPRFSSEKKENFLGPHNSKAKIITLFIKGMVNPEHRKKVEEELVRVRGLISIVFDLGNSRVTCRVRRDLSVEKLATAVARTETLLAQQVTTNSDGEEEILPLGKTPSDTTSPVEDLPDYLPEEDTPVKDASSAMAPSGSFMETATSFFSTASNLLQKSFYW